MTPALMRSAGQERAAANPLVLAQHLGGAVVVCSSFISGAPLQSLRPCLPLMRRTVTTTSSPGRNRFAVVLPTSNGRPSSRLSSDARSGIVSWPATANARAAAKTTAEAEMDRR